MTGTVQGTQREEELNQREKKEHEHGWSEKDTHVKSDIRMRAKRKMRIKKLRDLRQSDTRKGNTVKMNSHMGPRLNIPESVIEATSDVSQLVLNMLPSDMSRHAEEPDDHVMS